MLTKRLTMIAIGETGSPLNLNRPMATISLEAKLKMRGCGERKSGENAPYGFLLTD